MVVRLTREGLEKLKKELEHLENVDRKEVVKRIKHAASHGDLRENAGYHAAKDDQGMIEARIKQLSNAIAQAEIIEKGSGDVVQIGSTVSLKAGSDDERYQLVDPQEADIMAGKISIESSLGKALLGKKKGEVVKFETPAGEQQCKITGIE